MVSKEKKMLLSQYFVNVSLSNTKGGLPYVESGSKNIKQDTHDIVTSISIDEEKISDKMAGGKMQQSELMKALVSQLMDIADQVHVASADEGLKIEITETDKSRLFQGGGTQRTDNAKKILKSVAENVKSSVTRIAIESHTDSQALGKGETTWELSSTRAMVVRKELEANGVNPYSFEKIVSYGDRMLMDKSNPQNIANNRVNVVLLDKSAGDNGKKAPDGAKAEIAPAPKAETPHAKPAH
ncbi:MAG: OmpA family protein [Rectinemataceae bacterium]|nr:OmpA family protein [Rectinemataceae bacterium]